MAILARKDGWMISCEVLSKTKTYCKVKMHDSCCIEKVKHTSEDSKVFDGDFTMQSVEDWIMGENE